LPVNDNLAKCFGSCFLFSFSFEIDILLIENAANNLPAWAKLLQLFCTAQRKKQWGRVWGFPREKKMLKKPKRNPKPDAIY